MEKKDSNKKKVRKECNLIEKVNSKVYLSGKES